MTKGTLIVLEGLDGSGKATQAALLTEHLKARGDAVTPVSFPDYASESSALVRMYLAGEIGAAGEVNPYAASMFYAADRYISYETGWKKLYRMGHTIVSDRYTTSNAVHQMSKLPRDRWDVYLDWLDTTEFLHMELPRPDRVFYLDMPPHIARSLVTSRYGGDGEKKDIHERDAAYLESCRPAALYAAQQLGWTVIDCAAGDAPKAVDAIAREIRATLPPPV